MRDRLSLDVLDEVICETAGSLASAGLFVRGEPNPGSAVSPAGSPETLGKPDAGSWYFLFADEVRVGGEANPRQLGSGAYFDGRRVVAFDDPGQGCTLELGFSGVVRYVNGDERDPVLRNRAHHLIADGGGLGCRRGRWRPPEATQ